MLLWFFYRLSGCLSCFYFSKTKHFSIPKLFYLRIKNSCAHRPLVKMAVIRILLYAFILAILSQVYHAIERLHFDVTSQANLNADNRVFFSVAIFAKGK